MSKTEGNYPRLSLFRPVTARVYLTFFRYDSEIDYNSRSVTEVSAIFNRVASRASLSALRGFKGSIPLRAMLEEMSLSWYQC